MIITFLIVTLNYFFIDNQYSKIVKSNFIDNKTMVSWRNFIENVEILKMKDVISTILTK